MRACQLLSRTFLRGSRLKVVILLRLFDELMGDRRQLVHFQLNCLVLPGAQVDIICAVRVDPLSPSSAREWTHHAEEKPSVFLLLVLILVGELARGKLCNRLLRLALPVG